MLYNILMLNLSDNIPVSTDHTYTAISYIILTKMVMVILATTRVLDICNDVTCISKMCITVLLYYCTICPDIILECCYSWHTSTHTIL